MTIIIYSELATAHTTLWHWKT